jgi:hypothetical protein
MDQRDKEVGELWVLRETIVERSKPLEPEFSAVVTREFWSLLQDDT